jgi:hypothetical protein
VPLHSRTSLPCSRQYDAFRLYDQLHPVHRARCKIFSYEAPSSGKRLFLLTDISTFFEQFNGIDGEHRHVYELIREGFPCRLYFDLEFNIPANPGCDGDKLVEKWINLVLWKIYQSYSVVAGIEQVIVLDSTSSQKFSKHVHILLPNEESTHELLFLNNIEVGKFIQSVLLDITEPIDSSSDTQPPPTILLDGHCRQAKAEYEHFWVNSEDNGESNHKNKKIFFVDLGVYTRNRAFRLFYCCKYGKTQRLSVSPRDRKVYPLLKSIPLDKNMIPTMLSISFIIPIDVLTSVRTDQVDNDETPRSEKKQRTSLDSTPFGNDSKVDDTLTGDQLDGVHDEQDLKTFLDFASHFNTNKFQLLPPIASSMETHSLCRTANNNHGNIHRMIKTSIQSSIHWKDKEVARSHYARESTLFPSLDSYILTQLASRGNAQGYVQSWHLFHQPHGSFPFYCLRYQIAGNRYCECVQRMHKSNGIYFDVNLMAKEVQQGCWDIDCRGYKFSIITLDPHIIPHTVEEICSMIKQAYNHDLKSSSVHV